MLYIRKSKISSYRKSLPCIPMRRCKRSSQNTIPSPRTQCFCATTIPTGLSFEPEYDGCTSTCRGNTGEICGGSKLDEPLNVSDRVIPWCQVSMPLPRFLSLLLLVGAGSNASAQYLFMHALDIARL